MKEFKSSIIPKLGIIARKVENIQNNELQDIDITSKQSRALMFIIDSQDENLNQKYLEKKFELRASTVTSLVDNLEKAGYINRITSEEDFRCNKIGVTKKALKLKERIIDMVKGTEEKIFMGVTEDEKMLVEEVLNKILKNIIKMQEEEK